MHERQHAADATPDRGPTGVSVTWNDYRATHARRIAKMVRLRAGRIRERVERRKEADK
jgi:hypothetical protein